MAVLYKHIGSFITVIDNRNSDGNITSLMGISIDKCYIPSVANVIGTNLRNYKVIKKGQFACSLMQVSRDRRIPIAMYGDDNPAIMSPAYMMFEVSEPEILLPEYLNLWFKRAEFDREASFYAVGGVRGSLDWEDFCQMKIAIPLIEEQRKIVRDYQVISERIDLLKRIICVLEETQQTLLINTLTKKPVKMTAFGQFAEFIDGDRGKNYPSFDEFSPGGYCLFLSAANVTLTGFVFDNCVFVTKEKDEAMNNGHLNRDDIVLTSRGTLGNVALYDNHVPYENVRINSGMLIVRSKCKIISSNLLYALLKSRYMKSAIEAFKSGSAQPQLPIKDLQKIAFPLPTDEEDIKNLDAFLSATQESVSIMSSEIIELNKVQASILSRMFITSKKGA